MPAAEPAEALAERKADMLEERHRRPAGAALGAVTVTASAPAFTPPARPRARPGRRQLHPDPRPREVVAHQPDLLAQDLLGERAGAAAPQHPLAPRTEDRVHGEGLGQPGGRGLVDQRHPAQPRLRALTHLQLEGQPAGLQQRLGPRVAVDDVPHLGVGVLGALLDDHASVAVRRAGQVGLDPGEQRVARRPRRPMRPYPLTGITFSPMTIGMPSRPACRAAAVPRSTLATWVEPKAER